MPYQRIISTLGCAELNLPEALALAARHRIDGLELRALGGTLDLPSCLARSYGSPGALARELPEACARLVVLDTSLRLTGASAAERDNFLEFVPWAEGLGVRWLRVFDGDCAGGDRNLAEAAGTIRWWRSQRERHRWRVDCIVETHDSLLDSARIARFVTAAPGTKILWDTHHTWRHGEDPLVTWPAIREHVAHLHVKDSVAKPAAHFPYTYTIPGLGDFPMAPLVRVLRGEFAGGLALEWERMWHPYLPPLEVALDAAATHAWW